MKVLKNLTSRKGARIEFHLEDENDKVLIKKIYSHREFQDKMRYLIDHEGTDTGKNTIVHLLINSQGIGKSMVATKYAEWQAQEKKDWGHDSSLRDSDSEKIALMMISIYGENSSFGNEFVGPTKKEVEEINSDPENKGRFFTMMKENPHNCQICPVPKYLCPRRHNSYNHEKLKKALETLEQSPTE